MKARRVQCSFCTAINYVSRRGQRCEICGHSIANPRGAYTADSDGFHRPACCVCGERITAAQSWHADAFGYRHFACEFAQARLEPTALLDGALIVSPERFAQARLEPTAKHRRRLKRRLGLA